VSLYTTFDNNSDDNKFVELAIAGSADFLITSNIKDFSNAQLKFDSLNLITPGQFVKMWREKYE
jgi:predicted nucleic acid-binding protein